MALRVVPLTAARRGDWLAFFDGPAFEDNPGWADCYCMWYHFRGTTKEWLASSGRARRRMAGTRIRDGTMRGHLAYDGARVVGWVNAAPKSAFAGSPRMRRFPKETERVGSVVCFVVAPTHRGLGVARRLLKAALDGFRREGIRTAEAYPARTASSAANAFNGPRRMFLEAGFREVAAAGDRVVVQRRLRAARLRRSAPKAASKRR